MSLWFLVVTFNSEQRPCFFSFFFSVSVAFDRHMMGKRVNFACRSVISPDPYIGTNEIGLPFYFAKTLTYPTPVTERNVEEMRELVTRGPHNYPGAVWVEFPDGRRVDLSKMGDNNRKAIASRLLPKIGLVTVGRQLRNGDMVLMNRQVSWAPTKLHFLASLSYEELFSHAPL